MHYNLDIAKLRHKCSPFSSIVLELLTFDRSFAVITYRNNKRALNNGYKGIRKLSVRNIAAEKLTGQNTSLGFEFRLN